MYHSILKWILLLSGSTNYAHGQYSPKSEVPYVGIYNAKELGEPIPNNSDIVTFEEGKEVYLGLLCHYKKAVRWVFEDDIYDPVLVTFTFVDRKIGNFSDLDSYLFESSLELTFQTQMVNETYLACVSYEDNSIITVVSGKEVPDWGTRFTVWYNIDRQAKQKILSQLIRELPNESGESSDCVLEFSHVDKIAKFNAIEFLWTIPGGGLPGYKVDNLDGPINLENRWRNVQAIEKNCNSNDFKNRTDVANIAGTHAKHRAIVFSAETKNARRIANGLFSIQKGPNASRKFYFLWEDIPIAEMYYLEDIPEDAYDGEALNIVAKYSPYYFATGVVISVHRSNQNPEYFYTPHDLPNQDLPEQGTRVSNLKLTILKKGSSTQTIKVHFPLYNSSDWITVERTITIKDTQKPVFVSMVPPNEVTLNEGDENASVICRAFGTPLPSIEFDAPRKDIPYSENLTSSKNWTELKVTFLSVNTTTEGNYSCIAKNVVGDETFNFKVKVQRKGPNTDFSRNVFILFGVASLFFITMALFLTRRILVQRKEYDKKTQEAISDFMCGTSQYPTNSTATDANHEYNKQFELSQEQWIIGNELLGKGAFAVVVKGQLLLPEGEQIVAIKKIMAPSEIEDFKCALYELKLMTCLGSHPNVLQLIAACTDNINERKIMLALEYCAHGDLLSFLKKRRGLFVSLVKDNEVIMDTPKDGNTSSYGNIPDSATFNTLDLYKWSFQIANGMAYLDSMKVVHGDLSARNLLLTDERMIKISDFGLSRQMMENQEKKALDIAHEAMPWKWMAIESLKEQKLSNQSDMWSYGVTLWEIFSLGDVPYPGFTWGPEFLEQLTNGLRMGKTPYVTNDVYNLMIKSWSTNPDERPSFEEVKKFFMIEVGKFGTAGKSDYERNSAQSNHGLSVANSTNYITNDPSTSTY